MWQKEGALRLERDVQDMRATSETPLLLGDEAALDANV